MSLLKVLIVTLLFALTGFYTTQAAEVTSKEIESEHQHAVEIARNGKHDDGLQILHKLIQQQPENYPILRDIVIITSWTGDCHKTLAIYEQIPQSAEQEPYLITPVSECLYNTGQEQAAINKLEKAIQQWPDDTELTEMKKLLSNRLENQFNANFNVSLIANDSDQGNREFTLQSRYTYYIEKDIHVYARYITTRADDPQFNTGDLNRLGTGAHFSLEKLYIKGADFLKQSYIEQGFSFDTKRSGESGSTTTIAYEPYATWHFDISYASFAEDLPLRAKALNLESDRTTLSASYHTNDYLWGWNLSSSRYNFTDNNNRESIATAANYAYVLRPDREQRVSLELYTSSNTETNTVYYNPKEDKSITLSHQLDVVYNSQYKRHVDHIIIFIGNYIQKNQDTKSFSGIRFSQDYDFDKLNSLSFELAYENAIYDGSRENQKSFLLSYSRNI